MGEIASEMKDVLFQMQTAMSEMNESLQVMSQVQLQLRSDLQKMNMFQEKMDYRDRKRNRLCERLELEISELKVKAEQHKGKMLVENERKEIYFKKMKERIELVSLQNYTKELKIAKLEILIKALATAASVEVQPAARVVSFEVPRAADADGAASACGGAAALACEIWPQFSKI